MTTRTAAEFETADAMNEACATALRNLLVAIADTKLLLGYHYGEWTFGPPELEAAIAGCSLCQTELGHVRLVHGILKRHFKEDPSHLLEGRGSAEFANVAYLDRDLNDWARLVAANYVVDLGLTRLLHALQGSAFTPLRMSLEKMVDEERYHIHHGQGWFRTLCGKNEECRSAVQDAVREALDSVIQWFGPTGDEGDRALVEAGIKSRSNAEVVRDLLQDVTTAAEPMGVRLDVETPEEIPGWDPVRRRADGSGPDEEILYHLRGSKNEIYKLK
jgi:ring-1,2-phenylacetyl-CoA epoxidase subunit PaaC